MSKFSKELNDFKTDLTLTKQELHLGFVSKANKEMPASGTLDLHVLDPRRIILTNVLPFIGQDYLELYIEYLSNEVEIVRFDASKEIKDALVITFEKNIGWIYF